MVTQARDGKVEFRFFRPHARHVTLTGEFNGWHKTSLPMTKGPDGWWHYELRLAPGCYQFRYLGDGQWYTDYAAFGLEHGPFGMNSVVKVDAPPRAETQTKRQPVVRLPHISETQDHPFEDAIDSPDEVWLQRKSNSLVAVAV